jgi:hypothetical protein
MINRYWKRNYSSQQMKKISLEAYAGKTSRQQKLAVKDDSSTGEVGSTR